jgi:hypothetical protein
VEPVSYKRNGRELGNAAKCGEIAGGISWETWQWYVRTQRNTANPPPVHVYVDVDSGQRMYPLKDVRAWHAARPGRGNWGGIGARARIKPDAEQGEPADASTPAETAPEPAADAAGTA